METTVLTTLNLYYRLVLHLLESLNLYITIYHIKFNMPSAFYILKIIKY